MVSQRFLHASYGLGVLSKNWFDHYRETPQPRIIFQSKARLYDSNLKFTDSCRNAFTVFELSMKNGLQRSPLAVKINSFGRPISTCYLCSVDAPSVSNRCALCAILTPLVTCVMTPRLRWHHRPEIALPMERTPMFPNGIEYLSTSYLKLFESC